MTASRWVPSQIPANIAGRRISNGALKGGVGPLRNEGYA